MQTVAATIVLSNRKTDTTSQRLVKRAALSTFRAIHAIGRQSQKMPGLLAQAGVDIKSAWQEAAKHSA